MSSVLFDSIEKTTNSTFTLNGAVTNRSSLNGVLDLFAQGGAIRGWSQDQVYDLFAKAFAEDQLLALKTLFYLRDVRGGQGERKTFRTCIKYLADYYPQIVRKNLDCFAEYGRWDDLLELHNTKVWGEVLMLIDHQLKEDLKAWSDNKPQSLLSKWLPSINASSKKTKMLAKDICKALKYTYKDYRRTLSALRNGKIVEKHMCNKKWEWIKYDQVPSQAMLRYRNAFSKNDKERFGEFLGDVKTGKKEIKAGTLYPSQIVSKVRGRYGRCMESEDDLTVLDAQWNALPNYLEGNPHRGIAVVDVSGSMTSGYNTDVVPMDVAISLGLYFAERNECPVFGNRFITFSSCPELQRVKGEDIKSKVDSLERAEWGMSTDLQAVFDLILNTAKEQNLSGTELPEVIYIISDMEFDDATYNRGYAYGEKPGADTNFDVIKKKYLESGYCMPKIVYWNVDAKTRQVPVTIDDNGVCMVSGYSPSILTSLLAGEIQDPMQVMLDTINTERYERVVV